MHQNDVLRMPAAHKQAMKLMGNCFQITAVHEDAAFANDCIIKAVDEIKRIERLLTTFRDSSETAMINANAGIQPVKVSPEVYDLIERSVKISHLTQGAFDITYGGIDKSLWNFDTTMTALPDAATAKQRVKLVNYRNIVLDKAAQAVYLKKEGMRIGFGGIGKGYAAERAKLVMQQCGIRSGIVNASGDLTAWGYQPDGEPWTIGIANPNVAQELFSYLNITNMAVATSGNYEKFVMIDGRKYSHTIDPKTGLPVCGIKSVTIISSNAEIADAMATPVMIMGIRTGLDLVNQMKGVACIIVDEDNKIYTSKNVTLQ